MGHQGEGGRKHGRVHPPGLQTKSGVMPWEQLLLALGKVGTPCMQHGQGPPGAEVCWCCGRAAPPAGGSTQEATRREAHGLRQRWHRPLGAIRPASGWVGGL